MNDYDQEKSLMISQSISAIYDNTDASPAEACSATALALRTLLDNIDDKLVRAFLLVNVIKHLTMEKQSIVLRPNGNA